MDLADFDEFARRFRAEGSFPPDLRFAVPPRFNFARDVLDPLAADVDKTALWWLGSGGDECRLTFAEIAERSRRACSLLADEGVGPGDVVVVLLPRVPAWWVINISCLRMGAVISPGPAQLREADIEYRLQRTGARCVVAAAEVVPRIDAVAGNCPALRSRIVVGPAGEPPPRGEYASPDAPTAATTDAGRWIDYDSGCSAASADFDTIDNSSDDTAAIYFTSGTEGRPKMVAHTHVSFPLRSRLTGVYWLDLHEGELHWNLSDSGWAKAGWSSLYGPWNHGAAVFAVDSPRFAPDRVLRLLAEYPIDTMCAAPTVYRSLLLRAGGSITTKRLRHCVAAGEPLSREVLEQWRDATGIAIRDGFGQTESSLLAVNFPLREPRAGSMGTPVPGYDVQVIDTEGAPVAAGDEGDLAVRVEPHRPLGMFKEYVDDPQANAACRRGPWHVTGDRARRDDDGYFWFVARADDVIISSGYRIGPFEVESALLEHPAVAESAVVASPDAVRGEVVHAVVVLRDGYEPSDDLARQLQSHVKSVTAPYKYPRRVSFVDELPKTITGKIRRRDLRAALAGES